MLLTLEYRRIVVYLVIFVCVMYCFGCGTSGGYYVSGGSFSFPIPIGMKIEIGEDFCYFPEPFPSFKVSFYDENGDLLETKIVTPPAVVENEDAAMVIYEILYKNSALHASKCWGTKVDGINFTNCCIETDSPELAYEEYLASQNGDPSPSHSKTLSFVQLLPLDTLLEEWDLTIAEYREIVYFQVYYNGKLVAETDDGQITYDPQVGGRVKCDLNVKGKTENTIYHINEKFKYIKLWDVPTTIDREEIIVVYQTVDCNQVITEFAFEPK